MARCGLQLHPRSQHLAESLDDREADSLARRQRRGRGGALRSGTESGTGILDAQRPLSGFRACAAAEPSNDDATARRGVEGIRKDVLENAMELERVAFDGQ